MSRNGSPYHRLLNTTRWRSMRAAVLASTPFCADCAKEGVLTPATDVHHIVPVDEGASPERMAALAYDRGNVVALCHDCHHKRHVELRSHKAGTAAARAKAEAKAFWERLTPGGDFSSGGGGA